MDCSCAPIMRFPMWRQMAPQQTAKFRTAFWSFFYQFEEGQRRQLCIDLDSVFAICQRTGRALQHTKRFVVPSVGGATRLKIHKFEAEIFQNAKNRPAELCQILRMVTIEVVINSIHVYQHMRVTISCRYALSFVGRCFCFQFFLVTLRVLSTVRSRGAQFEQALRCRLQANFDSVYSVFRSTSKSRPNNIRGGKCPSVRPYVRTSVRP